MTLLEKTKLLICTALSLAACSGGSGPNVPQNAVITLDRDPIEVAAYVGTVTPVSVQILNEGRGLLTVTSVKLVAADGGTLALLDAGGVFDSPLVAVDAGATSDPLPVQIGGLQTGFIQFNYGPRRAGATNALLIIDSDAPDAGVLSAPVNACAVSTDAGPDAGCS